MNKYQIIPLFMLSMPAFSECINHIKTEGDLALSNICVYQNTALVKFDKVSLKDWYNPITYFKSHRIYYYFGTKIESFKGSTQDQACFFEWVEGGYSKMDEMVGQEYIVSFNNTGDCSLIDVGGKVLANKNLIKKVRNYSVQ